MSPRLTRLELALVVIVFAIGFGLRAAWPSRMAVEHFDEGVYASNLYTPEGRFPFQHLYAPPLVPFCLEWAAILGGPQAVMWVNVVSGSLTLLVLWGMVRQWWGPPAAIAATVLVAFNEFHIAYSRAALTDAMLGLWMTAGVWAGWRAIRFGGAVDIVAAGVLASLAWWTKYNGWLTLAVTGAGTAGWILIGTGRADVQGGAERQPPDVWLSPVRRAKRVKSSAVSGPRLAEAPKTDTAFGAARVSLGRWALTAAIAFLLWSPWLWELQKYGGYSAVAKNHAGYFTGVTQWGSNAWRQLRAFDWSFGPYSCLGGILFFLLTNAAFPGAFDRRKRVVATGDADALKRRLPGGSQLCSWMSAAWLIGLAVAVPLYTPYPRLMLPLLLGLAVFLAIRAIPARTSEELVPNQPAEPGGQIPFRIRRTVAVIVLLLVAWPALWWLSQKPNWSDRSGLRQASAEFIRRLQSEPMSAEVNGVRCAVYVIAEPGLYFHLAASQVSGNVTLPAADFEVIRVGANRTGLPWYVVVGPHAEASHPGEADRLIAAGRLEPIGEFDYRPSDLVLLDSRPVWDLPPIDKPVIERIRLLHVKP